MLSVRLCISRSGVKPHSVLKILRNASQATKTPNFQVNSCVFSNKSLRNVLYRPGRAFSTERFASKDPDVFGDIAGNEYQKAELDEGEREQEEFEKTEASVSKWQKLSPGQYADLIKEHIGKGDLQSAVQVLDLVKQNRDQPNTYMYNLLIRAHAVQGDLKTTWKLFTDMKKRALKLNAATYVSILNVCGNHARREPALEALEKARNEMMVKNFPMNEVHYNAMVKAYGRHGCLAEAFKMVDEMIDKKLPVEEATFNSLLCACISDKEHGLRHALVVWHMMQRWRKKPSVITYNLLLRAIRDTKMGELRVNDALLENYGTSRILVSDSMNPDLLAQPPVVSKIHLPIESKQKPVMQSETGSSLLVPVQDMAVENIKLWEIHKKNKMILFGGFSGFIERMERDGVAPDSRTMGLLLDVVPNSLAIEENLIQIARSKKIPLNIDFFNMLIKKRSFRKDYKQAKEVLDHIQRLNLVPDMITWGVLALGCHTLEDAKILLEGIETTGHTLNPVIAGTLIGNACCSNRVGYIMEIMQIMKKERIIPSHHTYVILDRWKAKIEETLKDKCSNLAKKRNFRERFETFKNRYEKMQDACGRDRLKEHVRDR